MYSLARGRPPLTMYGPFFEINILPAFFSSILLAAWSAT